MISDCKESSTIAFLSEKFPTICFAPAFAAGQFTLGSSTITSEMCSGICLAASVSIIPN